VIITELRYGAWEATRRTFLRWSPHNQTTPRPGDSTTRLTNSEKMLAEFDPEAGEWGHCEGVAPSRYDQVVHDWLNRVLVS
jgi:hypothetical protein